MAPIKNTKEELLLKFIKKGFFTRKRKPYIIPLYSLTQALRKISFHKLAKEVAFCLSTESYYRLAYEERYQIAFNSLPLKNWSNIAVVQLNKNIDYFDDLACVNLEEYTDSFKIENPIFMKLLLSELNTIRRS